MKTWLALLSLSLFTFSFAHADVKTVQNNLKKNFPDIPVNSVVASPVKDIYEVYMGGRVVYTNDDAQLFFVGNLIDLKNQKNLTEERIQVLNKIDISKLPLDKAIKHVKGNGSRVLYIFSDPDCPYCQRLEQELTKIDNVTIYLFLYPITSLHPNAAKISEQIWCSKDQYAAWENYVLNKKMPAKAVQCKTPIQEVQKLATTLEISGTPTFFLKDGSRVSGARSSEEIETLLKNTK
ncbi:DsbC family protein [Acinetobacter stercoris]|uniref:Thiol:disulfide interchange protein n=1 Tax=Acinetobacter stercoris TaxID=2126983 RepID=A0A2U3N4E8_9GAMM|nr:DsbC family protein [Acinetobacter stercoris]SPL72560.1 putative thiol:disulfide interchange protein DsbC precursor [Acinetobacter stercoris]